MLLRDTLLLAVSSSALRRELRHSLEDDFNILEAENGQQMAMLLEQNGEFIAALIVDLELQPPTESMGDELAVIVLVDADDDAAERLAFEQGAVDILVRPLHPVLVKRRVANIVSLYNSHHSLQRQVDEQTEQLRLANERMVDALSSLIEHRSAESGQHNLRIRRFTEVLLAEMVRVCPEYGLGAKEVAMISAAASLHDIGKIAIPDAILNKPGPLTGQEMETMKTHAAAGAEMLREMEGVGDREYLGYAYNICRYHHERWDGGGYPEGLSGDDIPICAQVVGLADAYDALTSDRIYKKAISCSQAMNMILGGECGEFSPRLLACFKHVSGEMEKLAMAYREGEKPRAGEQSLSLPGPEQGENSALQTTLRKYQALLHHMNATVLEMDYDRDVFHMVYNPDSDFAAISESTTFREALRRLAERAVYTDDRQMLIDELAEYMEDFFASGARKRSRSYRLLGTDGIYRNWRASILRSGGDDTSRRALCIWEKQDRQEVDDTAEDMIGLAGFIGSVQRCIYDSQLSMENVSSRLCTILGGDEEALLRDGGGSLMELVLPDKREQVLRRMKGQLAEGCWFETEMPLQARDGSVVWALFKGLLQLGSDGREHIYGMLLDISEAKAADEELRYSTELNRLMIEHSSDVIFEWDFVNDELKCSGKWQERFGYDSISDHASQKIPTRSHIHPDDISTIMEGFKEIKKGQGYVEVTARIADSTGRYSWNRIRAAGQRDSGGNVKKAVGIIMGIDNELISSKALMANVDRDGLTGLLNKEASRRFTERRLLASEGRRCAFAIIDLDGFKGVNDRYGHLFGDELLTQVAAEISGMFRGGDIVGRVGGDEFTVFLENLPAGDTVERRFKRLIANIEGLYGDSIAPCRLSASVGLAFAPEHGGAYQELFQRADRALYQAKSEGGGVCLCYDPGSTLNLHHSSINRRIESEERKDIAGAGIISYVFDRLYESGDIYGSMDSLLELIGHQANVSRMYIFENSLDGKYCSNTFEWCAPGVQPEKDGLQNLSYETDIPGYRDNFNERGIFYVPDVSRLDKKLRDILEPQGVRSLLQCAIRDGGNFRGYVGFDDCSDVRLWTQEQIDILTMVAQLLSVFLLKKRMQDRTEMALVELNRVLDNQYEWVYVVEPETYALRFINHRTQETVPEAAIGMRCHRVLMGLDAPCPGCPIAIGDSGSVARVENRHLGLRVEAKADTIHWDGEKAWLITCRNAED